MQVGDLVRRKSRKGEILGVVIAVSKRTPASVRVFHFRDRGEDEYGYYRSDLEVINESR
jgi:hypothetical protein